jgi:hypothetical protein
VQHVHWTNWAAKETTGLGKGWYVPENAGAQADGKIATEKVVAVDLGTCRGKRAYWKYIFVLPHHRTARRAAKPTPPASDRSLGLPASWPRTSNV